MDEHMSQVSTLSTIGTAAYNGVTAVTSPTKTAAASTTAQEQETDSVDKATFSSAALELSQKTSYASNLYPTRAGMSANALLMAVANPSLASSSKGLSFSEVATDARARMDDKYTQMKASGTPYTRDESADTNSLLGDLDRRSLYAVSSNEGGLFTKAEQEAASSTMNRQLGLAMGLYSGSIALGKDFVDPYRGDDLQRFKVGLKFLNEVSSEEKHSATWLNLHENLEEGIASLENPDKPKVQKTLFDIIAEMNSEKVEEEEEDVPGTTKPGSTGQTPQPSPIANAPSTTPSADKASA
jgi:hypothetical protein